MNVIMSEKKGVIMEKKENKLILVCSDILTYSDKYASPSCLNSVEEQDYFKNNVMCFLNIFSSGVKFRGLTLYMVLS